MKRAHARLATVASGGRGGVGKVGQVGSTGRLENGVVALLLYTGEKRASTASLVRRV